MYLPDCYVKIVHYSVGPGDKTLRSVKVTGLTIYQQAFCLAFRFWGEASNEEKRQQQDSLAGPELLLETGGTSHELLVFLSYKAIPFLCLPEVYVPPSGMPGVKRQT